MLPSCIEHEAWEQILICSYPAHGCQRPRLHVAAAQDHERCGSQRSAPSRQRCVLCRQRCATTRRRSKLPSLACWQHVQAAERSGRHVAGCLGLLSLTCVSGLPWHTCRTDFSAQTAGVQVCTSIRPEAHQISVAVNMAAGGAVPGAAAADQRRGRRLGGGGAGSAGVSARTAGRRMPGD
jgi:hypothetical protein